LTKHAVRWNLQRFLVARDHNAYRPGDASWPVERDTTTAKKVTFEVMGPFDVQVPKDTRVITRDEGAAFFRSHPHLRNRRGAYVFGLRSGGGMTPIYVGEATRAYGQECFTNDKLLKYAIGMAPYEKGTPILFFVASAQNRGRVNVKVIGDLEDFLIQNAKAKNPHLVNKKGTKEAEWAIRGVVRREGGKTSAAARALRSMMGFE